LLAPIFLNSALIRIRRGIEFNRGPWIACRDVVVLLVRDSSVGMTTAAGIESRCGARFSAPVQTGPRAQPASFSVGTGSFPEKRGRGVDNAPPSSAEYYLSGGFWFLVFCPADLDHLKIRVVAAVTLATRPFPNFVRPFA